MPCYQPLVLHSSRRDWDSLTCPGCLPQTQTIRARLSARTDNLLSHTSTPLEMSLTMVRYTFMYVCMYVCMYQHIRVQAFTKCILFNLSSDLMYIYMYVCVLTGPDLPHVALAAAKALMQRLYRKSTDIRTYTDIDNADSSKVSYL